MKLSGRSGIEAALTAAGELLSLRGAPVSVAVVGGAALNLLGFVDRSTIDVDVLAREENGRLEPPDPLPAALCEAIASVARAQALNDGWMNTTVANQWRVGLPPGIAERIHWRTYGALRVGLVDRRDLIFFKLYASADQTGPDNVHVRDLLALRPSAEELRTAGEWVRTQDPSPEFHQVLARVIAHVTDALL